MSTQNLNLGREAIWSMLGKSLGAISGFVGLVIFARWLGPTDLGNYYFLFAIAQVITQFTGGVGTAVKKRISEVESRPGEVLGFAVTAHLAMVAVVSPLLLLSRPYLPLETSGLEGILTVVALFGVLIGGNGLYALFNSAYAGLGNPARSTWVNSVRGMLVLGSQIALVFAGFGVYGLLLGQSIGSLIVVGGLAAISGVVPRPPSREVSRSVIRFAKWSSVSGILNRLYNRADAIIIGVVVGGTAVGYYEAALRLGMPAVMFSASISQPMSVKVSARDSAGKGVLDDIRNATSYAAALAIPLFFGGAALATELMRTVYGPKFTAGSTILLFILGYYVLDVFSQPYMAAIGSVNRPDITLKIRIVSLVAYAPAVYYGATQYGALGVISATMLAEVTMILCVLYATKRVFGKAVLPRPVVAQFVSGAVMFGAVEAVTTHVTVTGWPILLGVVLFGGMVYGSVLTVLSSHFRATVRGIVPFERVPGFADP